MPNNKEFLQALFGTDVDWVHVTDFSYDPNNIPSDKHLGAWCGDYFSRYHFSENTNQYFTVSTFYADEKKQARRRKALFRATHVIVLDDVKEKLSLEEVNKLPAPSWVLETSPGSEQWGYILDTPCTDRGRVENLLDGLVDSGLAPLGKDPGMKGVTRYVRLPDGYNNKASKLVEGRPFKCNMLLWEPFNRTTIEALAAPFMVNLDALRREARVDGATKMDDHPLLSIPDIIRIKEVRSDGRFDITCPWVDEHTAAADDGSAIFTNGDGTIGFKCHHGACQNRTGRDLLAYIEETSPAFTKQFAAYQTKLMFETVAPAAAPVADVSFLGAPTTEAVIPEQTQEDILKTAVRELKDQQPFSPEAREIASKILRVIDSLPPIEKLHWQEETRTYMQWTKSEFKGILKDLQSQWYLQSKAEVSFFDETIYIAELNQFYDRRKNIFYSADAYQNTYSHLANDARKDALQGGLVMKVDKLDYAPKKPPVFEEEGVVYGNSWCDSSEIQGYPGDVSCYLEHFDVLGWGEHRDHLLQWMAYTLQHPEDKINHMVILGSGEGAGKDWLLTPLVKAMGNNSITIAGDELLGQFNDYVLGVKHLHINEVELGDRREAAQVSSKIKPLAAAPPFRMRVNQKGIKPIKVRNLLSCSMTTNSPIPVKLSGASRRIFALWSEFNPRDENEDMLPAWQKYWVERWNWMDNGGAEAVINYLRHDVDVSKFNPGLSPPVTQFLRDIRESSKTPSQQTVEAFIRRRIGAFACDVVTAAEMADTLRHGDMIAPEICYVPTDWFTPVRVGVIMKELSGPIQRRGQSGRGASNFWVIRDIANYAHLTSSEIYDQHELMIADLKSKPTLAVVS